MTIVQRAIHAARHRASWGKYAARVYAMRHGVPSGVYRMVCQMEAVKDEH